MRLRPIAKVIGKRFEKRMACHIGRSTFPIAVALTDRKEVACTALLVFIGIVTHAVKCAIEVSRYDIANYMVLFADKAVT